MQPTAFGKVFDVNVLAVRFLFCVPTQSIGALIIERAPIAFVHLAIVLDGAVVKLTRSLNRQHEGAGRIPRIHQDVTIGKLLTVDDQIKHFSGMVEFGLAIFGGRQEAIVSESEPVRFRTDIEASHNPDATNHGMRVAAPLPPHLFDGARMILVGHRVAKD